MRIIAALLTLFFTLTVNAGVSRLSENSPLKHIKAGYFDEVAALPGWSAKGETLYIYATGVHFNEYWLNQYEDQLMHGFKDAIENNFKLLFCRTLETEFRSAGFTLVESPAQADILVLASVDDARIYSVQTRHIAGSSLDKSGSANLLVEFIEKEELKMFFSDSRETKQRSGMSKSTMEDDFERLMKRFSKKAAKLAKKH